MILATRDGNREVRTASTLSDFGISPLVGGSDETAGVRVTPATASSVPAIGLAVRIAAQAVACLDFGVYRGRGGERRRVTTTWQARLFAGEPNEQQTTFGFKETIEESLSYRSNAFVWKTIDPSTGRVVALYALHPDQVFPIWRQGKRMYQVAVAPTVIDPVGKGYGFYSVDERTLLHVRGHGDGGSWMAPSAVQRYRQSIGAALAKISHESNTFAKGTAIRQVVIYPKEMNYEQVSQWRDMWKETYGGPGGDTTAVLGGGGELKPIGMTQADAEFVASSRFSVEEVARIFNVQASLIGGGTSSGSDKPITPEHETHRWLQYGLEPRLRRIEGAFNADPDLFAGGRDYAAFDSDDVVRGDLATVDAIDHERIQDGRMMPDEWRAKHGLPPLPGGVGMIPQVVPVGGAPNPAGASPSPADDPGGAA